MSTGEVIVIVGISISVIAVLVAVIGMGLVIIQRIDAQRDRLEDKIEGAEASLDTKIENVKDRLEDKIERVETSLGSRISDVEREQARQSGVTSVLTQLARSPNESDTSRHDS